jgi:hypothetical protein
VNGVMVESAWTPIMKRTFWTEPPMLNASRKNQKHQKRSIHPAAIQTATSRR